MKLRLKRLEIDVQQDTRKSKFWESKNRLSLIRYIMYRGGIAVVWLGKINDTFVAMK